MFNMPLCAPSLFPILSSKLQLRIFNPKEYSHFMSISNCSFWKIICKDIVRAFKKSISFNSLILLPKI